MGDAGGSLPNFDDLNLDGLDDVIGDPNFVVNGGPHPTYTQAILTVNGQNVLINDHGGNLFDVLRTHAPHWYQVACEAYIAVYSWHGTTDARSLLPALVLTMIHKAIDTFVAIDPTWVVENVLIPIAGEWHATSFTNAMFMESLKKTISQSQSIFYTRSTEVVRWLALPSHTAPWQHPGIIPNENPSSSDQLGYVTSLALWKPQSGYDLWHDYRPNADGELELCWFERNSLLFLLDTIHFDVGSPGYLYIQEQYANPDGGPDEWGPLSVATFHSTTWILATVQVYLWSNVLEHQRFSAQRFTSSRRDAILHQQVKISILFKQILRRRVPGLSVHGNELAYIGLHNLMHTNPELPFLI